ncbi:hypothetical protein RKD24_005166 [Streptomyces calvus]
MAKSAVCTGVRRQRGAVAGVPVPVAVSWVALFGASVTRLTLTR